MEEHSEDYGYGRSVEEIQQEEALLNDAYNNSYLLLTNTASMEFMMTKLNGQNGLVLAHNDYSGPTKMELENMILFFIETEEYEKCSVLKSMLNEKYPESINESLEEWL
tara:strand:+ start:71 stop:397 length:327 start_codon:yes stop_codon:yes gene_type:complete